MENKAKYTPGPSDIVRAFMDCQNEDTRLNEAVESASMELDWSDTPDATRNQAEAAAVGLMLSAPELLAALERLLECQKLGINLDTNRAALYQAVAAIAKAKGE